MIWRELITGGWVMRVEDGSAVSNGGTFERAIAWVFPPINGLSIVERLSYRTDRIGD